MQASDSAARLRVEPLRPGRRDGVAAWRTLPWLAGVAAAFVVSQFVLVVPGSGGPGWDETVSVSQVSPHAPAAFLSAPRARGITLLVAPVTALTSSTEVLRIHLALLSGCGFFLALWVWRRLLPPPVLAMAGGLFAGPWITQFYGPRAMPNLWVALGALAVVGCFARAVRDRRDDWALATPVAQCLIWLVTSVRPRLRPRLRPAVAVALALVLGGHLAVLPDHRRAGRPARVPPRMRIAPEQRPRRRHHPSRHRSRCLRRTRGRPRGTESPSAGLCPQPARGAAPRPARPGRLPRLCVARRAGATLTGGEQRGEERSPQ